MRYGYHSGPYGVATSTLKPRAARSRWSCGPHAVEHLELEPVAVDPVAVGEPDRVVDQPLVVRRDRDVGAARERPLEQPPVGGVDVGLLRVGDVGRLEVGALHEAQVRCEREQRLEVVRRPVEVRLKDAADVLAAALTEPAVDAERRVDDARVLHVDPHEVAALGRVVDERAHVLVCQLLVDQEPQVGQLDRQVGPSSRSRIRSSTVRNSATTDSVSSRDSTSSPSRVVLA